MREHGRPDRVLGPVRRGQERPVHRPRPQPRSARRTASPSPRSCCAGSSSAASSSSRSRSGPSGWRRTSTSSTSSSPTTRWPASPPSTPAPRCSSTTATPRWSRWLDEPRRLNARAGAPFAETLAGAAPFAERRRGRSRHLPVDWPADGHSIAEVASQAPATASGPPLSVGSAGDVRSFPDQARCPLWIVAVTRHTCSKHGFVEHFQPFGAEAVEPIGAEVRRRVAREAGGVQGLGGRDLGRRELTRRIQRAECRGQVAPRPGGSRRR